MDTFKAIMVPLAVLLLGLAVILPPAPTGSPRAPRWPMLRWALAGAATVLAAIAVFVAVDTVP